MIVSHKYKYIFLKTNKTAGTSIEIALSKFCGVEDIITPIQRADEIVRQKMGYPGPQNYLAPISDYNIGDVAQLAIGRKRKLRYYNHMPAKEIREYIGRSLWDDYYKFCFERNPWDRLVSLYFYRHKTEPRPTMSEFIESGAPRALKRGGIELYSIDGAVAVDRVCLYEKMTEELEFLRARLGLPESITIPNAKASFRTDKRSYTEMFGESEKEKIETLFAKEIDLYAYSYDSPD